MPTVNFVGDISFSTVSISSVSVTWAIVPGNAAWYLKRGLGSGETHTCETCWSSGKAIMGHPIDCQYETSTVEGWPLFVCEIWDRTDDGFRGFHGCGSAWLPMTPGKHQLEIQLWRPVSSGLQDISGRHCAVHHEKIYR
ncbi:B9 domain-containing protein [Ochromonadaceae sp. CCMP2298]|nr:B9 domain-containing protein [Ochromonadaceae sp. CCMP2298]